MHVRTTTTTSIALFCMSKTSTIHMNNSVKRGLHLHGHKSRAVPVAFDAHNHIHLSKDGGIPPLSRDEMMMMMVPVLGKTDGRGSCTTSTAETTILDVTDMTLHARNIMNAMKNHPSPSRPTGTATDEQHDDTNMNIVDEKDATSALMKLELGGMALMSTQPRDFPIVRKLSDAMLNDFNSIHDDDDDNEEGASGSDQAVQVVRCYGVHPWFLRQANEDFAFMHNGMSDNESSLSSPASASASTPSASIPWLPYLAHTLQSDPASHVGEIGLDGARYEINPTTNEKVLVSTMESQIEAFEAQMHLAADLRKCVSVHAVQCWGPLMDSLRRIKVVRSLMRKERRALKRQLEVGTSLDVLEKYKEVEEDVLILPPKVYFHAFGGKTAVIDQLDAICRDEKNSNSSEEMIETFYGFAPVVNFRSPKTASVIQKVGIGRLVLESDLEDYSNVMGDLKANAEFIAEALEMEVDEVLCRTHDNARRLYGLGC